METNINITKGANKIYEPIPEELNTLSKKFVESAFMVHKNLGPGLLEKVYEICFCYELEKRGIKYSRQLEVPIIYETIHFKSSGKI